MKTTGFTIKEIDLINFKKRKYVRKLTAKAIREGVLVRSKCCDLCNDQGKIQAHHIDYGKPIDITWLCTKCHAKVHSSQDHPLNPKNNTQTPMPYVVEEYRHISIEFQVPIKTFLALSEQAKREGKSISQIMKKLAMNAAPVENEQLEFNFEEKQNDRTQNVQQPRICSVETYEGLHKQSKCSVLSEVRGKRNNSVRGMGKQLLEISARHGANARKLQRPSAN